MVVHLVGPVAHPSDVDTEVVWVLGGRADGEGMPLVDGDGGDLDEAPVPWAVVELGRLLDPETGDSGGQGDALVNDGVAAAEQEGDDPIELLRDEDDGEEDHPLPEAGRVQDQQPPVQPVVQVREVEHLPCVNQSDVSICRASANQK